MDRLPEIFLKYKPYIDRQLKSMVEDKNLPFYGMIRYHLGWADSQRRSIKAGSGKYLRATLCLLGCESTGTSFAAALPLAGAIEYVHNFSLVHDDIQDNDRIRRHRPTVWSIWGKPQAINAGSAMRIIAGLALHDLGRQGISDSKHVQASAIMDQACLNMLEGQYMDISFETRARIGLDEYLSMIEKKTSALIQASLMMGACLNKDQKDLEPFRSLGLNLGLAFQIKDDMLGIWGNDKKTGKISGSDIRKKKKSFPIIFLMGKLDGRAGRNFREIYSCKHISGNDLKRIMGWLDRTEARQYSQEKADDYYKKTLKAIQDLPVRPNMKEHFKHISEFLVKRNF